MANTGVKYPATGANLTGVGTVAWTTPTGIQASGGTVAAFNSATGSPISNYLKATGFDFSSIPSDALISGIVVEINRRELGTTDNILDNVVSLVVGGAVVGTNKATATEWPTALTTATYGTSTDLWGLTPTVAQLQDTTNFGVVLSAKSSSGTTPDSEVDFIRVTVHYNLLTGWNGIGKAANHTLSNSDKTATSSSATAGTTRAALGRSTGKYSFILKASGAGYTGLGMGFGNSTPTSTDFLDLGGGRILYSDGSVYGGSGVVATVQGYSANDLVRFDLDLDAKTYWVTNITAGGNPNNSGSAVPFVSGGLAYTATGTIYPGFSTEASAGVVDLDVSMVGNSVPAGGAAWDGTSSGPPARIGSLSVALGGVSAAGSGAVALGATLARTAGPATVASAGAAAQAASLGVTLQAAGLAATAATAAAAGLTTTLGAATLSANAGSAGRTATLAITLSPANLAASGATAVAASATISLASAAASASGQAAISGSLSRSVGPASLSASGLVQASAALAVTLQPATVGGTGSASIVGNLSASLGGVVLSATGAVAEIGSLAKTLAGATLSAAASSSPNPTGNLAVSLAPALLGAQGAGAIAASLARSLSAASLSAQGSLAVASNLSRPLTPASLGSTAQAAVSSALASILPPVGLTGSGSAASIGSAVLRMDDVLGAGAATLDIAAALAVALTDAGLSGLIGGEAPPGLVMSITGRAAGARLAGRRAGAVLTGRADASEIAGLTAVGALTGRMSRGTI